MAHIRKIFSFLICIAAAIHAEQSNNMGQFMVALERYKQSPTPQNAQILVAEYDNPKLVGKDRPLTKQILLRGGLTINRLRIQAKETAAMPIMAPVQNENMMPANDAMAEQMVNTAPQATRKVCEKDITHEELEIKKIAETLKNTSAAQAALEQKVSDKMEMLAAQEAVIVDRALIINVNSIKGQSNDLHGLVEQTKKAIAIQHEIKALQGQAAQKQQERMRLVSELKQKQAHLAMQHTERTVQQAQAYHDHLRNLTHDHRKTVRTAALE